MTPSDNQRAFNVAYAGLQAQGFKQSINPYGDCLYRGPDGLKCAVGHMIPDKHYDDIFDHQIPAQGSGIRSRGDIFEVVQRQFPDVDREFLADLQDVHDNGNIHMQAQLHYLAERYNLEVPDV